MSNGRSRPKVYLAGPISGLTYDQGQDWRVKVAESLDQLGIDGYSPLRAKSYLKNFGTLEQSYQLKDQPVACLSSDRGLMTRDRWDVTTCDAILVNLVGATRISVGTMIEVGMADILRKPLVLVMEEGNPHDHPMLREATGFRVPDLGTAVEVLDRILNPNIGGNRG
jgi:nucleoside 2-deoxyribosyltransferase